jgi:hypothetical protein
MKIFTITNLIIKAHKIIFIAFLFIVNSISYSQFQNVKIGNYNSYSPQEPTIVVDPKNTNNLLVAANTNLFYYSTNGGFNWTRGLINSNYGIAGDPCVVIDSASYYYYFHLVPDLTKVVCQKTTSLGSVWSNGSFTGVNGTKDNDKEWAVVDKKTNYLYVAWAQFDQHGSTLTTDSTSIQFSRSTDQGLSWSQQTRINKTNGNAQGGNLSCHAPMPAVGPNGDVYVTWMSPLGLMVDISHDNGITWLNNDIKVTPSRINWLLFNIPGIQRAPGFPIINCDLSNSIYNGNIYICWADQRNGSNNTDIWVVKSTNGGYLWSNPKKVNNDQYTRHQFFPWMTIDQTNGYIYFIFYDRRNYTDNKTDVYMAISKDGGDTFENIKISETPFTPLQSDFIGDYIGITAYNNVIGPVWTRVDNGSLSLWTAIINSVSNVNENSNVVLADNFALSSAYPNPFNPSTTIEYTIKKSGFVSLKVYDISGKEVSTIVNSYQTAGDYKILWKVENLTSGIYLINLQFNNLTKTIKTVLMK